MPVPKEHVGVQYRQNAATLKIYTDGKPGERRVSQRQRRNMDEAPGPNNPYTDSDAEPTLVTFKVTDEVDVDGLLATGAVAVYTPPAPVKEEARAPEPKRGGDPTG